MTMHEDGSVTLQANVLEPVVEQMGANKKKLRGLNMDDSPVVLTEKYTNKLYSDWHPSRKVKGADNKGSATVVVKPKDMLEQVFNLSAKGHLGKEDAASLDGEIKNYISERFCDEVTGDVDVELIQAWLSEENK